MTTLSSAITRAAAASELTLEDKLNALHSWGVLRCDPGERAVAACASSFIGEEATLDGGAAARLLCAYGRMRHRPSPSHAAALATKLVSEAKVSISTTSTSTWWLP